LTGRNRNLQTKESCPLTQINVRKPLQTPLHLTALMFILTVTYSFILVDTLADTPY
jgi:hypothetical protein